MKITVDEGKKTRINQEIDTLIELNGGTVNQELIVREAHIEGTALNEDFKKRGLFDAEKTMRYAQLTYARILLANYKVWVEVENKEPVQIRALVSLTTDRGKKEGGYRPIINVMNDAGLREQMLVDAKKDLAYFKKKYAVLSELAPVFEAIEEVG